LSVIIVSYKCRDLLNQCLESIQMDPLSPDLETIVVDNASGDESVQMVRENYPHVRVIANQENVGFPAANNQALATARGEHLLLLNPDTVVTTGALSTLARFLDAEPGPKIVGLNVRNPDGSAQHSTRESRPGAAAFIIEQIGLRWTSRKSNVNAEELAMGIPQRVGTVSGAALAFTRTTLESIGGFDEDMFWAEDMDFCFRAGAAGIPVFYLPAARILHYGGESGRRNFRRMLYAQHASRVVFAERHYGKGVAVLLRAALTIMLPAKMSIRAAQFWQPSRRSESRDRLAGYWDALKFCVAYPSWRQANRL
jgi:GT2 family glycosyltransferase